MIEILFLLWLFVHLSKRNAAKRAAALDERTY